GAPTPAPVVAADPPLPEPRGRLGRTVLFLSSRSSSSAVAPTGRVERPAGCCASAIGDLRANLSIPMLPMRRLVVSHLASVRHAGSNPRSVYSATIHTKVPPM